MGIQLIDIIDYIRPNSQFVIYDNDLNSLEFHDDTVLPTEKEIKEGKAALELLEKQKAEQIANDKAAILEKLGITEDEAKLLLS